MTPTDLESYTRQRYNAVGDTFFPQAEIFNFFYAAQMELAMETKCIKNVYTTTTVASQRAYDFPSLTIAISRLEVNGQRVYPNDFMDDDATTGNNPDEVLTGQPTWYQIWGDDLYLRPVPSTSAQTIRVFSYNMPNPVTAVGTLDIPARYHLYLSDYAMSQMCAQDGNNAQATSFMNLWTDHKKRVLRFESERDSSDDFKTVKLEEWLNDETRFL